jgi:hypothetical protein
MSTTSSPQATAERPVAAAYESQGRGYTDGGARVSLVPLETLARLKPSDAVVGTFFPRLYL